MADPTANSTPVFDATKGQNENNVEYFTRLLNSGQYQTPQAAIDAFNGQNLKADKTGLSSFYGSSPAFYNNGLGQIGLPDRYFVKQSDGTWQQTMRPPQQAHAPVSGNFLAGVGMPTGGMLSTMAAPTQGTPTPGALNTAQQTPTPSLNVNTLADQQDAINRALGK